MALIERTAYPRYNPNPSAKELADVYVPTLRELEMANRATRGGGSSLGFLVSLKSFQRLGYFPNVEDVPGAVVSHLRFRLGLADDTPAMSPPRSRQRYRDVLSASISASNRSGTTLGGWQQRRWPRQPIRWTIRPTW